ncbi:MAG: hypothetical protein E3J70_03865 [Candidatus Heimdallarchaeota archaeon]|nr:MAG: hypothetical protein E3J70_03865 [Candidatus Heimdallarchaeota archaeon]
MKEQCEKEVIELHKFFEEWFKSEIENKDELFARFEDALGEEFMLITPTGEISSREQIITQIRNGYGSRKTDEIPYRLWVQNIECRLMEGNLCLVIYEEWGEVAGDLNARLSSALFRKKDQSVNGVEWVHVHEVSIPTE